ncbi:MAG: transporter [Nitrospirota bacterium]
MRHPALGAALGVIIIAMTFPAWAGPWTVAEGETIASLSMIQAEFDELFNIDHEKRPLPGPIRQRDTVLGLSYGLVEDWEASLQVSAYDSQQQFPGNEAEQSGLGDTRFGVKHLVYRGTVDVAAQVGMKLPGSYDADVIYAPGDGQADVELRTMAGKLWDRAFVALDAAYRFRAGAPSDEYEILLDTGYAITSQLHGRVLSRLVNALSGVGSADTPGVSLKQTEEDIVSVGGALAIQPFAGVTVTLQYMTVVAGRNTPARPDIGVSLAYSFDFFL